MINKLDKQYTDLLQDILDNGVKKETRNGGTLSVFGRQIRHKMSEGFPLLTTKKMPFKTITTELLWFLRGDTNIKYLVDNDCHIWDGDAYKNYCKWYNSQEGFVQPPVHNIKMFIERIKTDDKFAKQWGELGPIYGKQWRKWGGYFSKGHAKKDGTLGVEFPGIDQIQTLISDLKTNPDSRRLMVNAWNVGELDQMTLPPCHYGFQVYTRELSYSERRKYRANTIGTNYNQTEDDFYDLDKYNIPTRAISLMWNQRSVDTFLGLPFNIASYGLLLEIIAKTVNMVPDELIGNLGDVHLYSNHVEQAKEQIGRELSARERTALYSNGSARLYDSIQEKNYKTVDADDTMHTICDEFNVPRRTRQPFPLPTLNINTEFWPTESGECGIGSIDASAVFNGFHDDSFCKCLLEEDIQLSNYQSHPSIKAPLSN